MELTMNSNALIKPFHCIIPVFFYFIILLLLVDRIIEEYKKKKQPGW